MRRPEPQPESLVERRIREAQQSGKFAKLAGHGKPLKIDDRESSREEWASNHVLKNAGMLPPWMDLAKEIDRIEDSLAELRAEQGRWVEATADETRPLDLAEADRRQPGIAAIQRRYLARTGDLIDTLTARVDRFNFIVPARNLLKPPIRRDRHFAPLLTAYQRLTARYGWDEIAAPDPKPIEEEDAVQYLRLFDDSPPIPESVEDEEGQAGRRQHVLDLTRKLRDKRPSAIGIPLAWIASINPLGHAADLLRKRRQAGYLDTENP